MARSAGKQYEDQDLDDFTFSTAAPSVPTSFGHPHSRCPQYFMCFADELFLDGKIRPLLHSCSHNTGSCMQSTVQSIPMYELPPQTGTVKVHEIESNVDYYENWGQSFLSSSFFKASAIYHEANTTVKANQQATQDVICMADLLLSENSNSTMDAAEECWKHEEQRKKKNKRKQLVELMLVKFHRILHTNERSDRIPGGRKLSPSSFSESPSSSACSSPSFLHPATSSASCRRSRQEYNYQKRRTFLPYRQSLLACLDASATVP